MTLGKWSLMGCFEPTCYVAMVHFSFFVLPFRFLDKNHWHLSTKLPRKLFLSLDLVPLILFWVDTNPSLPTNRKMINYLLESVDKRRDFSNLHISVHDWLLPLQKYEWLAGALRVALWLLVRIVCVAMGSLDGGPEMFAPNGLVNILHVLTLSRRILKRRPKSRSWFITLYWLWLTHLPLVSENKRLCGAYKVYFYPMFLGLSWILAVLRSCDLWCVRKVQGAFVFFGCMVQLSV